MHVANHFAQVGRDAHLKHVVVSLGGEVVRVNPVASRSPGPARTATCSASTSPTPASTSRARSSSSTRPTTPRAASSTSGALQGDGAHTVWIGDVLIGPDATGTDTYEQNRNLVLTDGTRADSVPNLEIETGDIVGAGHASATGRFDDEQLFYLQARGITEDEARRLVVRGFLSEIVQKIGVARAARTACRTRSRPSSAGADRGMSGRSRLRASTSSSRTRPLRVVVDGVPDRGRQGLDRRPSTPSATPARTATSRSPRASSRTTPSSAGRTAPSSRS